MLEKLAAVRRRSDAEPLESPPLGDGVMDCSVGGVGMINLQRGECTLAAAARGADSMGGVSMGGETMGRGAPGMDASAHSNAETTTPAVLPDIHATLLNNNNNNNNNEKTPPPAAPDITPLSSTHPLLADAHATLERQLQQQYTTLQQQLHEARGALTRAKRHREQQGVLLHQHQQALTRVQGRVDSLTTECAGVVQARVDKEAQVEVLRGEEMVEANKCARDMQQVGVGVGLGDLLESRCVVWADMYIQPVLYMHTTYHTILHTQKTNIPKQSYTPCVSITGSTTAITSTSNSCSSGVFATTSR